jgi:uncharacterized spore protein YtfJ
MENTDFLEKLSSQFAQSASVKNVYGEPIITGNKTIIPIAQIMYGLGGGYGQGKKPHTTETGTQNGDGMTEGGGGGGGIIAWPKGVYEITATGTRFIPASNKAPLLIGLVVGFLLRGWLKNRG